jgi:hypothetical protein
VFVLSVSDGTEVVAASLFPTLALAADGSLKVLWDSQRWNVQFLFKFDPPVVDDGQIYVPNYNGGVDLYRVGVINRLISLNVASKAKNAGSDRRVTGDPA